MLYLSPPDDTLAWKMECFYTLQRLLQQRGIAVETAECHHWAEYVKRKNRCILLVVDEDELRGAETLYQFVLNDIPTTAKFSTYRKHIKHQNDYLLIEQVFKWLQAKDVSILSLYIAENQSGFLAHFNALIEQKYKRLGLNKQHARNALYDTMKPKFFEEIMKFIKMNIRILCYLFRGG